MISVPQLSLALAVGNRAQCKCNMQIQEFPVECQSVFDIRVRMPHNGPEVPVTRAVVPAATSSIYNVPVNTIHHRALWRIQQPNMCSQGCTGTYDLTRCFTHPADNSALATFLSQVNNNNRNCGLHETSSISVAHFLRRLYKSLLEVPYRNTTYENQLIQWLSPRRSLLRYMQPQSSRHGQHPLLDTSDPENFSAGRRVHAGNRLGKSVLSDL